MALLRRPPTQARTDERSSGWPAAGAWATRPPRRDRAATSDAGHRRYRQHGNRLGVCDSPFMAASPCCYQQNWFGGAKIYARYIGEPAYDFPTSTHPLPRRRRRDGASARRPTAHGKHPWAHPRSFRRLSFGRSRRRKPGRDANHVRTARTIPVGSAWSRTVHADRKQARLPTGVGHG